MSIKNDKKYVPEYNNDALSGVLDLLKLDVEIYHNAKVCGDWRINEHKLGATCFHIVTLGRCFLSVPELYDGVLDFGDLVIFPRELTHSMRPMEPHCGEQQHLSFKDSMDIKGTGLLCGEVNFQHKASRYLLDTLPPVFIIKYTDAGSWLKSLLRMVIDENQKIDMASKVIFNKLSELLFVYAIRQYVFEKPDEAGILSLYSHNRIAKAISAVHKHPDKNWTLDLMAKEAMLSRTAFSKTFKAISGWTAGQYLVWWRMYLAWSLLKNGQSIAQVSDKVGYHSESSFSRAFKNMFGVSAGKVKNNLTK